jgi:YDG domain
MKKNYFIGFLIFIAFFGGFLTNKSFGQIVISGYLANPAGTDSPYEYVQCVATQNINFASNNYCVVWANNGTATSNGWIAGGVVSFGFNLTSGSVTAGQTFYVGGSGKLINGVSSTDISSENWIKTINTATIGGDGFGTAASGGVMGNGGTNADGIGIFAGQTSSLTNSSVPIDAVFFGTGVGTAKPATGGYILPTNDKYSNSQGTFGNGTNTFLFPDPASGSFTKLTGTYNTTSNTWTSTRNATSVVLTATSLVSSISSGITITSSTPTITSTGALTSVNTTYGTPSATPTSFTVSGSNLTNDILITPPTGYEISKTVGGTSGYASTQTLTQTSVSVASTIIYVRLRADATVSGSPYSGNIVLSSTGATSVNVQTVSSSVTAKELTISGITADNKVFDGNTDATLSGTATLNGVVGTDDVTLSGTPTATFNNRNIGTAKPITIAGYSLSGLQSGNYSITQPSSLTSNITALALTINNPLAQNKVFDGNTNATITGTLTGVISPDVVTFVGTGTFASSAIGNGIAVTSTSTLSGADAGNYTLTQPTGLTANITGPPTIVIDVATTSNYIDGGILTSPTSPYSISGVINDPTDPAKTLGIDFTIADASTPVGSLIVTATSSNTSVLPNANLVLTGTGASRNLKITSIGAGFSTITITVNNGSSTASFTINYASSNASVNPAETRFHTGTSDASTAQMIDNNLMIVGDDENQALRLYNRQNSGLPVASFNYTTSLGLTDISGGNPREVDIEASAKVGNRIYWMGSHSNSSGGGNRPNRSRFFATDIAGTGNTTTLSYIGRYDNLKTDLLAWDTNNGHGLGANFLGLTASSATGKAPEIADGSGFNIEGFEIAPNGTTAYICFRAPLQTTTTRTKALIIPLTNFASLVSGNPTSTTATFGTPIQLDLGGRAIREMKKNASGEYLIIAGPHDVSTGIAPKDFRFYTWTGNPNDAPILRSANLTALNSGGSFESIVDLPSPLLVNSNLQVLVDNGDAIFYGNGIIAKDLPQNNHKKFRSELINLGNSAIAIGTISGTSFCENASINIPFTSSETFNSGNIFTAQLSNAMGSFANPVVLGTLTGTSAGTISGTIPMNTVVGNGYRIRVVSSNFSIVGSDNGINLTINNCTLLATIKSIQTGNWESTTTWDLGRIPQAGDLVIIDQNHEITLNGNGSAKKIEYQGTGKIRFNSPSITLNTGL